MILSYYVSMVMYVFIVYVICNSLFLVFSLFYIVADWGIYLFIFLLYLMLCIAFSVQPVFIYTVADYGFYVLMFFFFMHGIVLVPVIRLLLLSLIVYV